MERKALLKLIVIIVIILLAAAATGYILTTQDSGTKYHLIDFDNERALQDELTLTGFGPRMTGTEPERQGAEYIKTQFEEAGLEEAHIEEFPEILFEVNNAELSLVTYVSGPLGLVQDPREPVVEYAHTIDFVLQGFSGSRSWRSRLDDLEVVNVGDGTNNATFANAAGKAVIIRTTSDPHTSNTDLFLKAWEYGAEAAILHNVMWGATVGYLPIFKSTAQPESVGDSNYPDIPFFMVSKDVGDEINNRISNTKLRINFDVTIEERPVRVVVGDIKGKKNPDDLIILGAHHDTVYNGLGAVDNTVGTVTIVELARQLGQFTGKLDTTIRLCTFAGEEEGLYGSIDYYEAHKDEFQDHVKMYLNFDMNHAFIERDNRIPITPTCNETIKHMNKIKDLLLDATPDLEKYEITITWNSLIGAGSDQWIFVNNGHKVAACWGSGSWEYHTHLDTPDYVTIDSLSVGGRIFGTYALYLAGYD
ncbi:MAG: M28 family peptidase [Thermoplasmata archaeon]|nr:M28 family peptidase [Thermoplasmata archaeon]